MLLRGLKPLAIVFILVSAACAAPMISPDLTPTPLPTQIPTPTPPSSPSPISGLPTTPLLAPLAPTLKSPPNGSLTTSPTPTLEWQPLAGNVSYGLQVATDQNFANLVINENGLKEASYVVLSSELGYSRTLYWRVGASNAGGRSGWSPSWTFVIPRTPAPKPTSALSGMALERILGVHAAKATGEQKVIVIIAHFPDVKPAVSREQTYDKFFVAFDNYLRNASYGQVWLTGRVTGPYVLPRPISDYNISIHNLEADRTKVRALVTDAMNAADSDVIFSQYDHVIIVVGAAYVREFTGGCYCAIPGMLGHSGTEKVLTKSGQTATSACVFSENCHLGNLAHDTIHMLGGVIGGSRVTPCLYDQDLQSSPATIMTAKIHMGNWDPLSCHIYKPALPPTGLSSWTKLRLGWIEPSKIVMVNSAQTTTVRLDPLDSPTSTALVIKIPLTSNTFYLVENRQKVAFDRYAPSSGILISYADDGYKGECRHGQGPVQLMDANPAIPDLEGASFDMGKKEVFVDSQNNLAVVLLRNVNLSYEIKITTADKVDTAPGNCVFPTFPKGFQRTK